MDPYIAFSSSKHGDVCITMISGGSAGYMHQYALTPTSAAWPYVCGFRLQHRPLGISMAIGGNVPQTSSQPPARHGGVRAVVGLASSCACWLFSLGVGDVLQARLQKQIDFAFTSISWFIIEGNQDRNSNREETWKQELMERPWSGAAYLLTAHGLLSYSVQDHQPKGGTTYNSLGSPPSIIN